MESLTANPVLDRRDQFALRILCSLLVGSSAEVKTYRPPYQKQVVASCDEVVKAVQLADLLIVQLDTTPQP